MKSVRPSSTSGVEILSYEVWRLERSNLGEIEDYHTDGLKFNEDVLEKIPMNSTQNLLCSIDSEVEDLIIEKLSNQLGVLQQELRTEQSEWLRQKSLEALNEMNAEIYSTNERFESFKSDILDICSKIRGKIDSPPRGLVNNFIHVEDDVASITIPQTYKNNLNDLHNSDCFKSTDRVSNVSQLDYSNEDSFSAHSNVVQISKLTHSNIHHEILIDNSHFNTSMNSSPNKIFLNYHPENVFLPCPEGVMLLNHSSSINPYILAEIRWNLHSSLLKQLFRIGIVNHSDITNTDFLSLSNDLQSTRDRYSDNYPNYFLARKITLSDISLQIHHCNRDNKSKLFSHPMTELSKESKSIFESSSHGHSESLLLTRVSGVTDQRKGSTNNICNTSWDSENSDLVQGCNRFLPEIKKNKSFLQATATATYPCDRDGINKHLYIPLQILEETIPSDFSLSDLTDYSDLTSCT
ncbi:hypothetical protein LOD99_8225 [Oopsacas minuta]|uniref:Uncharacterized protein n=1 Tax=Oopsacas minuta TaxID=111878 RepID=A0AAV7JHT3_9METZ|nr:hypothetical protein LOD99_8225 [Oopsacas minuta]